MSDLKTNINEQIAQVEKDLNTLKLEYEKLSNGNASAATRARNSAMDISKSMKTLRENFTKLKEENKAAKA